MLHANFVIVNPQLYALLCIKKTKLKSLIPLPLTPQLNVMSKKTKKKKKKAQKKHPKTNMVIQHLPVSLSLSGILRAF